MDGYFVSCFHVGSGHCHLSILENNVLTDKLFHRLLCLVQWSKMHLLFSVTSCWKAICWNNFCFYFALSLCSLGWNGHFLYRVNKFTITKSEGSCTPFVLPKKTKDFTFTQLRVRARDPILNSWRRKKVPQRYHCQVTPHMSLSLFYSTILGKVLLQIFVFYILSIK